MWTESSSNPDVEATIGCWRCVDSSIGLSLARRVPRRIQILVTDKKIDQVNDLIPLLEAMVKAKEPLCIVAEDVVGEALSALVVNKMRGVLDVVRIEANRAFIMTPEAGAQVWFHLDTWAIIG